MENPHIKLSALTDEELVAEVQYLLANSHFEWRDRLILEMLARMVTHTRMLAKQDGLIKAAREYQAARIESDAAWDAARHTSDKKRPLLDADIKDRMRVLGAKVKRAEMELLRMAMEI